jgi:hypothetical protein
MYNAWRMNLTNDIWSLFPMKCKITEDASLKLINQLNIKRFRVLFIGKICIDALVARFGFL